MNQNEVNYMENTEKTLTKHGIIIFLPDKKGSKSEEVYPYLYESANSCSRIMLKNDNPFENTSLRSYDGQQVEIICHKGRSDIFIIDSITKKSNGI